MNNLEFTENNIDSDINKKKDKKFCKIIFKCQLDSENTEPMFFGGIIFKKQDICEDQKSYIAEDIYNNIVFDIKYRLENKKTEMIKKINEIISNKDNFKYQ